jgi:hypothetical protein
MAHDHVRIQAGGFDMRSGVWKGDRQHGFAEDLAANQALRRSGRAVDNSMPGSALLLETSS